MKPETGRKILMAFFLGGNFLLKSQIVTRIIAKLARSKMGP